MARAMFLTIGFMVVEVVGGVIAGSLALLADAGHMLTDSAALALAWLAFRIARRPPDMQRSYGYHRFPVLAAFVNGVTLVGIVVWIAVEAVQRLNNPVEVLGGVMMGVAIVGLLVNIVAFRILHGGHKENLNIQGALLHVIGDMLGSVAAIVASVVIFYTGWTPIDPILSLFVALLILRSGWMLVRRSSHVLMQGTPDNLEPDEVKRVILQTVSEVDDVHHMHVWSLTSGHPVMTMHAHITNSANQEQILTDILACLKQHFHISHATVQLEYGKCLDEDGCETGLKCS
ncbi:cation diffusion facilitator family transporter [Sedimenticola selenatireducens]|uniref:cation diffusion facilitator family transporter n=1 Tax=Sedimenticola selenatireducens TaxID=191960 RepID=UPI0004AFC6EA